MTSRMKNSMSVFYEFLIEDLSDARTKDWFLISSPIPGLLILGVYLTFVTNLGPKYMSKRKPLDLNIVLIFYNFIQVLISIFLVYEAIVCQLERKDYSIWCQDLIADGSAKEAIREARCIYVYFLAKISELLDTVFFVLRKKNNQVTFLHIYHHSIMPFIAWNFCKYCPGGHIIFSVGLNSFIHVIMYLYYMLAACGPQIQKYLWWKKYITLMQMIQFLIIAIHNIQVLRKDCNYPKATLLLTFTNAVFFIYLFNNFYKKSYRKVEDLSKEKLHQK